MARLFTVVRCAGHFSAVLIPTVFASFSLQANPPAAVTNGPPAAPAKPVPAAVPDTFNRYGKIWAPSDDVAHPIKLNVQFPGIGDMKIPSADELNVRDKLEQLATLSDADIHKQLDQWPPYSKMKLGDQGQLLLRIQAFKEQRTHIAMDKAQALGLYSSLMPDQKVRFEKDYWDKRLQMDHELAKQFEPILKAREQKMDEELFREFSVPPTVTAPSPKPPQPPLPLAQTKPVPVPPPPAKPAVTSPPPVPIAQGKLPPVPPQPAKPATPSTD